MLVMAVVVAPASWAVHAVNRLSQGSVVLSDGAGTVWAGSALVTVTAGAGSREAVRLPGRLQWTMGVGWGRLHLDWAATCCMASAVRMALEPARSWAVWSGWSLHVQALQSNWPAALLSGLGTPWNTLQLQGNLSISSPGFRVSMNLNRIAFTGDVTLEAQDVRSRLSTLQPLGSYRVQFTGGEQPALALATLKGSLHLSGQGRWSAGRLRFEGEARAEPAHAAELDNLLNLLGRRDGVRSIITLG